MGADTTLFKAEVNKLVLVSPIIWSILIVIIAGVAAGGGGVVVGLIIAAILVGTKYLAVSHTNISLTNTRLMGKTGVINTKSMDSPLSKVNNVSVEQGLGGKIFNYSTLAISTSSGSYNFKYIKDADFFKSKVMEQIENCENERLKNQAAQLMGAMTQNR